MDSGVKVPLGLSFDKSFTLSECELLVSALDINFGLKANIYNKGIPSQYCIFIPKRKFPKKMVGKGCSAILKGLTDTYSESWGIISIKVAY